MLGTPRDSKMQPNLPALARPGACCRVNHPTKRKLAEEHPGLHNLPAPVGVPVRIRAFLVWVAVVLLCAPTGLTAAGRAAASIGKGAVSLLPGASFRTLAPVSITPEPDPVPLAGEAELFDDSPLAPSLLLLAAWLPIAGGLLALAMEGTSAKARRAPQPGGEISLD